MSCTNARDSAIGALLWTATKSFHCSADLPELDRALAVVAAQRRLADPGIVDKDVDHAETGARLGDDLIDRLHGEIGLDRHEIGALLPLLRRLGKLGETVGGAVDRRDREPLSKQARTNSRPMPPAAPVTIATRCCSLIVSSLRSRQDVPI